MQKEDPAAGAELGCPGKAPALYLERTWKTRKSVILEDKNSLLHGGPGTSLEKQVGQREGGTALPRLRP